MITISIERQSWYGIGIAHVFNDQFSKALCSFPINTKEELKELKSSYPKAVVKYQK